MCENVSEKNCQTTTNGRSDNGSNKNKKANAVATTTLDTQHRLLFSIPAP
eukprot:m.64891 g.64891  ORF g.64891 m.64891 type:complete len:50 (+) comp19586_c0_seq4:408-557(+)